jgi:hypothetical protein
MYQMHVKDGGKMSINMFKIQIPDLMQNWRNLNKLDSYESLLYNNIDDELKFINKQFINDYKVMYSAGAEILALTPTDTMMPEDYQKLDIRRSDDDFPIISNSSYRNNNKIEADRTSRHIRNYDRDNDGLSGRSMENSNSSRYDMNSIHESIDQPYRQLDYLDTPYYGQID